jgi:hypothetical protein
MRTLSCVASLVVCVSLSQYALANGLVFQLPENGRWAEFQMKTAKQIDGEEQWTDSGVLRVASVGQLDETARFWQRSWFRKSTSEKAESR